MISRSTDVAAAVRHRQRGFLLNPFRFGGGASTDPNFASVALLAHFDSGPPFVDSSPSPKTYTAIGSTPTRSTTHPMFGAGEMLTGASAAAQWGSPSDWRFLHDGSKWTIEGFWIAGTFASNQVILATSFGSTAAAGIYLRIGTARTLFIEIYRGSAGTRVLSGTFSTVIPTGTTYRFLQITFDPTLGSNEAAFSVDGGTQSFLSATGLSPIAATDPPATLTIAAAPDATTQANGYYDEWRITNGVIRPNTVPSAAFPNS